MQPSIRRAAILASLLIAAFCFVPAGYSGENGGHRLCSTCHLGESAPVRAASGADQRCATCHEEAKPDPFRRTATTGKPPAHADCATCHAPHENGQPFQLRLAARTTPIPRGMNLDEASRLCVSCHSEFAQIRGPRGHFIRHPVGVRLGRGQRAAAARMALPLVDAANTADPADDVLSCLTCHDLHQGSGVYRLRWDAESEPGVCRGCHVLDDVPGQLMARSRP